jgi:hypothetical protein
MFQILSLFRGYILQRICLGLIDTSVASREKQDVEDTLDGQRLVRLPIDELQQQTSE